jgi:hypothetical protein
MTWLEGADHATVATAITALYEVEQKCEALPRHPAKVAQTTRRMLVAKIDPLKIDVMLPRPFLPDGDAEFTAEEQELIGTALDRLARVLEVPAWRKEAELIERAAEAIRRCAPEAEREPPAQVSPPAAVKARSRRLLQGGRSW